MFYSDNFFTKKSFNMKNKFYFFGALFLMFLFSFAIPETEKTENPTEIFAPDFVNNVVNSDLEARFEMQFSNLIADVTRIDVHYNDQNGHYYAVHGTNAINESVTEYFATTAEEVAKEMYNYIEITERTMSVGVYCYRGSFPFPLGYCSPWNNGPICGVRVGGGCLIY